MSGLSSRLRHGPSGLLLVALCLGSAARAVPISWDGSSSRQWNTAANWTPAQVPTLADDVTFPQTANRFNPRVNAGINAVTRTVNFLAGGTTYNLSCLGATTLTVAGNGATGFTSAATTVNDSCPTILSNGQLSVSGTLTLTGALTAATLTKTGAGTVNINANSTNVGAIALNAGTILVGNTLTGTSATAASGTTLGGAGAITGTVTIASGATLDPGTAAGTGNLDTGPLIMNAGSTLAINFSGAGTLTSVNVTGTATVAGTVNLSGSTPNDGSYALVTSSGTMTNGGVQLGTIPGGKAFGIRVTGNSLFLDVATVPIRIDATSTASSTCTGNLTWAHAVSGNDRLLVVGVSVSSTGGVSPSAVTYGGTALTLRESDPGGSNRVFLYTLTAPVVGTANVVVTMAATAACGMVGGSMSFTGVNQATPIGNTTTTTGTNTTATATVSLTQGDRLVGVLAATNAATATEQSPATLRYRVLQAPVIGSAATVDRRVAGTGNATVAWTLPGSTTLWSLSAVALNAVAPTGVTSAAPVVRATDRGTAVSWRAGPGLDVVGYRVWREVGGQRMPLTPGLVAGPVMQSRANALAGRSYAWEDLHPVSGARYWLESLHTSGKTTWEAATGVAGRVPAPASAVAFLGAQSFVAAPGPALRRGPREAALTLPSGGDTSVQWRLAAGAAAKLAVRAEGVYRVPAEALFAAGIPQGASASTLQLFRDGRQVPMDVQAADGSHLQAGDTVEFYGIGNDTRYTDTAVYWLVSGQGTGQSLAAAGGPPPGAVAATYLEASELRERLVWFGAVQNGDREKFFGSAVLSTPSTHLFSVDNLDPAAVGASLEVALAGITEGPHAVSVTVNGLGVGSVTFDGMTVGTATLPLPPGLLVEGDAQVSLTSAAATDISLEDHLRLVFPRRTARATGALAFSLPGGATTSLSGFPAATAHVLDVTDPGAPLRLAVVDDGTGAASVQAPGSGARRLLAYLPGDVVQPASVIANAPSTLHAETAGADLIVVGPADLLAALGPLLDQRHSEGLRVLTVDVDDLRDEYAFGAKSAQSLRDYLQQATTQWVLPPRFVLLAGTTTYDPRDYLGLGGDRMSSGTVQTDFLEVASDHWFVDFPGGASIAVGRFPVHTTAEASLLVSKTLARQLAGPDASVLLVADQLGTSDFQSHLQEVASRLPSAAVQWIVRGSDTDVALHDQVLARLRQGPAVVDYAGHGSELFWADDALFNADDARQLSGSGKTSLYVHATCETGFFQDPRRQSLAVASLLTDGGGAWGTWASTGWSRPSDHPALNAALVDALVNKGQTLGEATRAALATTDDATLQATFVLLGDPSARLTPAKSPALTVDPPAPKTGCGAVDGPAGLLPLALAAAWLLRRRVRA